MKVPPALGSPRALARGVALLLFASLLAPGLGKGQPPADAPTTPSPAAPGSPLAPLKKEHPRLLVDASTWGALNERRKTDAELDKFLGQLETQGRALLDAPPIRYEKTGRRLLAVSRTALSRVLLWSFDYRLTGDEKFLRRAEREMLAATEFADWNPSHFLDVGEMTAALALGYDWLYDKLDPDSRTKIREAIATKGLRQLTAPEKPSDVGWQKSNNNWNQVCFGGLTLGALAIANEEPDLAEQVLARVKANNPNGMQPYAPDGVYPEGPSYWSYGTTYEVILIAALKSALGTDWGLAASPGFTASTDFLLETTAPSGRVFNYSDGTENADLQPALFWFAQQMHDPSLLAFQFGKMRVWLTQEVGDASGAETARFLPLTALWWVNPAEKTAPHAPLRWLGRGAQPLAIFREAWADPNAMWLALKGGSASLSHAHMDAGSFVFEAGGERWARDLGMQEYYSLESKGIDLWNGKQNSDRWKVFRLNNHSHNVLTINDQLQRVDGSTKVVRFSDDEKQPGAVLDLSSVYAGQAAKVTRGFAFRPGKHVLVRDELEGLKPGDNVRWAMVTGAEISANGREAALTQNGKSLCARLLAPTDASFEVIPADPPKDDFNAPNPRMRILVANVKAPESGRVEISVLLSPGTAEPTDEPLAATPLEQWPGSPPK